MKKSFQNRGGPVVLVSRQVQYTFPLSYAYLAGYLLQQGENVKVMFRQPNRVALVKQIMDLKPVLVGFGNLYPELPEIMELIKLLNQARRRFPIVIGGQMVSPIPEFAVKLTGADFGVIGEGEIILHQLICALREGRDPSYIKGLAIRQGDVVVLTGPGPFIEDLSKLPPIPYELFPESEWLEIGRWYNMYSPHPHWRFKDRVINVHGGRGCPFRCNFCYHHNKARYRPIDLILAEAQDALERFNGNMLYFSDDLVLATPRRARELVDGLRKFKQPIAYSISTRFDILNRLDDDLLAEMRETGCRIMGLGLESGSDRMLKIIGKNCTSAQILYNLKRLAKVGILPTTSIMLGQFGETRDDVEASIQVMRESVRDNPLIQYVFTVTTPFPGSPLYEYIMKNNLLRDDKEFFERYISGHSDRYFSGHSDWNIVYNLSQMSNKEVWNMHKKITFIYVKEQQTAKSWSIRLISFIRKLWNKPNRIIEIRIISKLSDKIQQGKIIKIYRSIRNAISYRLEIFELKLLGLK